MHYTLHAYDWPTYITYKILDSFVISKPKWPNLEREVYVWNNSLTRTPRATLTRIVATIVEEVVKDIYDNELMTYDVAKIVDSKAFSVTTTTIIS